MVVIAVVHLSYSILSNVFSLMLACYAGKLESVKELRHNSASYNLQDKGGSTALHWAMDKGDTELIEWLIEDGADIHMKDYNGWTPLHRVGETYLKRFTNYQ